MTSGPTPVLTRAIKILFFLFLVFAGLYFARPFLVPVAFGGIIAMLFLPICRKLEEKRFPKALAAISCIFLLVLFVAGIGVLLAWQVSDLASDLTGMEKRVQEFASRVRSYINSAFDISPQKQQEVLNKGQAGQTGIGSMVSQFLASFFGFAANTVIVLIYIFLFLFYRIHLKKFILRLVPADQRTETQKVIRETSRVAQKYLIGLALMIVTLWVLYSIGFSIAGVRNAIFFAILCGLLEIVPFVGNITGTALTILMAMTQGGGTNMIVIILVTYVVVQFFQTYILEPLIVGSEVNINPFFTILGIILGELIWGIPGMVLAIPTLGILRVIFDHVPALQPYGFLIGEEKKKKKGSKRTD